jgi:hypothetical protein
MRVCMTGVIGSASLKTALAAWLVLTNLSLGLYHRHEAADERHARAVPHQAAPTAWHYHWLLLGVELDFLSLNAETCPFSPTHPADGEAHLLLGNLLAPGTEHQPGQSLALLLTGFVLPCLPPDSASADSSWSTADHAGAGLPPPAIALCARSGVQQI